MKFESRLSFGLVVDFNSIKIRHNQPSTGTIVGVGFTKDKVMYAILDSKIGVLVENVPSDKVKKFGAEDDGIEPYEIATQEEVYTKADTGEFIVGADAIAKHEEAMDFQNESIPDNNTNADTSVGTAIGTTMPPLQADAAELPTDDAESSTAQDVSGGHQDEKESTENPKKRK
jgi:hypothetical protein